MADLFGVRGVGCVSEERGRSDVAPLLVVRLAGTPVPKGRPRFRVVKPKAGGEFVSVYSPAETRDYENRLRAAAIDAMAGREILDGPLEVVMFVYLAIPESWSARKRESAMDGVIRPTSRPDFENLLKVVDAFNPYRDKRMGVLVPIVWRDDACVVDGRVVKLYAKRQPGIIIEVRRAGPAPEPYCG